MRKKPRLCFVGSMLGQNAGFITTQGQILAELFAEEGFKVICSSSKINRVARIFDIIFTLIKNRNKFDLVLLEVYSGLSLIIADAVGLICKIFNLPLIMVLHGGNLPEFSIKYPRWSKRVFRRASELVAPSSFLANAIGEHGFNVQVIPNVIELDFYPFRTRSKIQPKLLWMRSFHQIYNPHMAVEVLAKLIKVYPDASLTMAGVDKGLEPEIKKLVSDLNLDQSVSFPGFLDAEQKKRQFNDADIFLNTNRADNMPVSVIEAAAFGLPVISTNVGGLPFLLTHGENGLLVENENADEMAKAVKILLENPDLTQKISQGGRMLAERSGWKTVYLNWENLFAVVLSNNKSKSSVPCFSKDLNIEKQKT